MSHLPDQPMLIKEEQYALFAKGRAGDDAAYKALVESHLPLVARLAAEHRGVLPYEDRFQEGAQGLCHAVNRFDPATGNMLASYAVFWIRKFILKAERGEVGLSEEDQAAWGKLTRAETRRWAEGATELTCGDLAEDTKIPLEVVDRLNKFFAAERAHLANEGHADGVDVPAPEEERPDHQAIQGDDQAFVRAMIAKLNAKERQLLTWRHWNPPQTVHEIAVRLGSTDWAARQLLNQAHVRLRRLMAKELPYRQTAR